MNFLMPPPALGVINGYLREQGIEVDMYDLNIHAQKKGLVTPRDRWLFLFDKEKVLDYLSKGGNQQVDALLEELLADVDFDVSHLLGISIGSNFSFFEVHCGFVMGRYIQRKYGKTIVFGGDNVQYMYQFRDMFGDLWRQISSNFRYILVGPGEKSLVSLMEILERGEKEPGEIERRYRQLKGAVYYTAEGLTANDQDAPTLCRPSFKGLDTEAYKLCLKKNRPGEKQPGNTFFYKWPATNALMLSDLNRVKLKEEEKEETLFIPYIFNYNCPYKCAFCTQSKAKKQGVISKDAEAVVDDLEAFIKEYGARNFFFFNNTFNVSPKFVRRFCELVKERDLRISWSDCGRFTGLDEELVRLMAESGCRKLIFGLDSGSKKILKLIGKHLDLDHARKVMRWCKEYGIWPEVEIIVGFPHSLQEEFMDTYNFVKDNIKILNAFHLNKYFVVPESLMGTYPERYGMELIKLERKYEKKLEQNRKLFLKAETPLDDKVSAANFHIYHFNEVGGRNYKQIIADTQDKARRFYKLYTQLEIFGEIQLNTMLYKLNLKKIGKNKP